VVSGITIFEKLRPLYRHTRAIELSYLENFFTVDFSALAGLPGTAVEYAYRLDPYDREWVSGVSRNFAPYTGVRGGTYAFQVKARYKDGAWSEPATLTIRVRPPFWETWWFRAAAGTGIALLVVYAARVREKRLVREGRERSELRERITASEMKALRSQMNPHFLYNSLNAIRLFILQHDSDNAEKYLVKFARLMRLILDNSRQEWVSLAAELEQLQLYLELEKLRFDGKFDFAIRVDPQISPGGVSIPPMIIQPFIENAILHGMAHKPGPGCITVLFGKTADGLECTVDDDGVGRQQAGAIKSQSLMQHQSVGMQVTEERLRLIGLGSGKKAGIAIIDKVDDANRPAGTRVVIELPLAHV
jgi:anti-sigma regulatory factor (Ser/Thr protein kinase)